MAGSFAIGAASLAPAAKHSDSSTAGKSGSGGGGGSQPAGACKRVNGSDADCAEFWEDDKTQAYACDDTSAATALKNAHDGNCVSTSGIPGGKYGMCCAP